MESIIQIRYCNFYIFGGIKLQAALVLCGLFICDFSYIQLRIGHFSRTYPLIYSHPWSFYMQIRYMRAYFFGPHVSHITRETCTTFFDKMLLLTEPFSPHEDNCGWHLMPRMFFICKDEKKRLH